MWKGFATSESTPSLEKLHDLANDLWQEERKAATPEELAAHSAAWELEDIDFANDPDYRAFKREMDRAFGREPN
jgi:hypothetical protein